MIFADAGQSDAFGERLQAAALASRADPAVFLAERDIFGALSESPVFTKAFANALASLGQNGTVATLDA